MITKQMYDWAVIVLDSGLGHPKEVRDAQEICRRYEAQRAAVLEAKAETAHREWRETEEKQS